MGHREPAERGCRDGRGAVAWRLRATEWDIVSQPSADVAIIGGGPGGYEAALVAAQLGAEVTVVEADGLGGARGLSRCGPRQAPIGPPPALRTPCRSP